jgi:hypothetical protein
MSSASILCTATPGPRKRMDGDLLPTIESNLEVRSMRERMTYYVAAPIARRDDGVALCDEAIQCGSPEAAVETARQMALSPFYVGAWAFSRTGYPSLGWFEDAEVLKRFGGL